MILLHLERLLEQGYIELGTRLGRRIYAEEIQAGASVDDVLSPMGVGNYKGCSEDHIAEAMVSSELSEAQLEAALGPPAFKRISHPVDGWKIEYSVFFQEELPCYQQDIDRLVKECRAEECVRLELESGEFWVDTGHLPDTNTVSVYSLMEQDELWKVSLPSEQLHILIELSDHPFDPQKIYEAVMSFLNYQN